jgi:CRISPR-associated endonuclease/helicase Cas3
MEHSMLSFADLFKRCCASKDDPFPYQEELAERAQSGQWPALLDIPTGLGKTAAVVIAWLWARHSAPHITPKRLIYCLPMRVLTRQVAESVNKWLDGAGSLFAKDQLPTCHVLMGGDIDNAWINAPERPAIIIGTQDQLISRALNRGYASSRAAWPRHFGLLHDDALWLFDETQLMGVAVETSAQLQGLRQRLGTWRPTRSLWMSATLADAQLHTVDHTDALPKLTLSELDHNKKTVLARLNATKTLSQLGSFTLSHKVDDKQAKQLAQAILQQHVQGTRTLVIVNRVALAQALYQAILNAGRAHETTHLIHSRFRPCDRQAIEQAALSAAGDQIIVATQAIEAGVDISSKTLITALAPWPSLVQRFGRCNRYGEHIDARVFWIDLKDDEKAAKPYLPSDLQEARALLLPLLDVGPSALAVVPYTPPAITRPVLRKRDLLELFDTSPDMHGDDIDISRYVRDSQHSDVHVFWGKLETETPPPTLSAHPDAHCAVAIGSVKGFLDELEKERKKSSALSPQHLTAWTWQPQATGKDGRFQSQWMPLSSKGPKLTPRPGMVVFLSDLAGGYHDKLGWTGERTHTPTLFNAPAPAAQDDSIDADPGTARPGRWVHLTDHLQHVEDAARSLSAACALPQNIQAALATAARWHDVGKAHPVFQDMLTAPLATHPDIPPPPSGDLGPWAKSSHNQGRCDRPHFRHELASTLAWLACHPTAADADLIAFLIASHHGKVRLSLRSLPDEAPNCAYGVRDGDLLPPVTLPDGTQTRPLTLSISPLMTLGEGSWAERTFALRDDKDLGPFRLAFIEAVLRAADGRATAAETEIETESPMPPSSTQGAL